MKKKLTFEFNIEERDINRIVEGVSHMLNSRRLGVKSIITDVKVNVGETLVEENQFKEEKYLVAVCSSDDALESEYYHFINKEGEHRLARPYTMELTNGNLSIKDVLETRNVKIFDFRIEKDLEEFLKTVNDWSQYHERICTVNTVETDKTFNDLKFNIIKLTQMDKNDKRLHYAMKYNIKNNFDQVVAHMDKLSHNSSFYPMHIDVAQYKEVMFKKLKKLIVEMKNNKYADKRILLRQLKAYLRAKVAKAILMQRGEISEYEGIYEILDITNDEVIEIIDLLFQTNTHRDFYHEMYELFTFKTVGKSAYLKDIRLFTLKQLGCLTDRDIEIINDENINIYLREMLINWTSIADTEIAMRKSDSWNMVLLERIIRSMSTRRVIIAYMEEFNQEEKELFMELLEEKLRKNIAIKELGTILSRFYILNPNSVDQIMSDLLVKVILEELDLEGERNKMLLKSVLKHTLTVKYEDLDTCRPQHIDIKSLDLKQYKNLRKELMNIKLG